MIFNSVVSTVVRTLDSTSTALLAGSWRYILLVLDDVSLFLEASVVKIQAFVLLAADDHEFSRPSMSGIWSAMPAAWRNYLAST